MLKMPGRLHRCKDYCPIELALPEQLEAGQRCIGCQYCYLVCPTRAIEFRERLDSCPIN
jgi:ferredoxin